jgi:heme/copper-type cytochrome/quinol oxidase subunit 3
MSDAIVLVPVEPSSAAARSRSHPAAWWGMVMLIITESMIFAALISSDVYIRAATHPWPPPGVAKPELGIISAFTVVLLGSSAPVAFAERSIRKGNIGGLRFGLALGFLMGAAFLGYTLWEFWHSEGGWTDSAYFSLFHTIIGLHAIHVALGLAMSVGVQAKAWTGRVDAHRHMTVRMFGLYWHFVDAVWVVVFTTLYLSVALG